MPKRILAVVVLTLTLVPAAWSSTGGKSLPSVVVDGDSCRPKCPRWVTGSFVTPWGIWNV